MKNNLYGRNFIKKEWSGDFRWIYKERAELAPNHSLNWKVKKLCILDWVLADLCLCFSTKDLFGESIGGKSWHQNSRLASYPFEQLRGILADLLTE